MLRRQLYTNGSSKYTAGGSSSISSTLLPLSSQMRFSATMDSPPARTSDPTSANSSSPSSIQSIHRDLLKRSMLVAKPTLSPTPPSSSTTTADSAAAAPPKKATLRPFVPVKHVLYGTTTVSGGIDGLVNASIDALIPAGGEGPLSQQVLLWIATFLSARPAHQEAVSSDIAVLPIVTVLCELEKDVYSSAREHKKSSIYKASKDKAATTMDNAKSIHHALDHAAQARFLELKVELQAAAAASSDESNTATAIHQQQQMLRIELARMLINNVLIPLYDARLVALSSDFVGFLERFDNVSRSIDEIMLRAHVFEVATAMKSTTPLIDLFIDDSIRNSAAIISGGAMGSLPTYFSDKPSRLSIPADDSITVTLTPVAAAAKASLLAPATNILVVLYADKQYINNNILGIIRKHRKLKEDTAAAAASAAASKAAGGGPTMSPTLFKMTSSSSSTTATAANTPPPANLSPETVLKVASTTQVLPHTLTRSTVDRESIHLLNALQYPHPVTDNEEATDIHGNKAPKPTPEEKKRREQQIAEENKFLQHTPTIAMIQSVIAKAYGVNNYTFGKSQKVHYGMTVIVPMAIRFIKGDLPFLLATISEEAKGANKKKTAEEVVVEATKKEDLNGAPNFPHFLDMRHSTAGTTPWHPAFSLFKSSRPTILAHHPSHAAASISPLSRDDFGFLIGLSFPLIIGFILGVFIMINLGKGIYWAVQWLIDEGAKAGTFITATAASAQSSSTSSNASITSTTTTTTGVAATTSAAAVSSIVAPASVSISAASLTAAFDDNEPAVKSEKKK